MKVIDLLNKIANGKEVPKKFIFEDREFYLQSKDCWRCDDAIFEECFILEDLNKEIEIIEEDKKIEKLETYKEIDDDEHYANILKVSKNGECEITEDMSVVIDKINEIIKAINEMREDK